MKRGLLTGAGGFVGANRCRACGRRAVRDKLRIPLPETEALRALLKVKPTSDMPRPGANPTGKPKRGKRVKPKRAK